MNYDYRISAVNPNQVFAKRAALYLAILSATVALALIVLLILFERYLWLILPGAMFLLSACIWFIVGRIKSSFGYHYAQGVLTVEEKGRTLAEIPLSEVEILKNAEKSDFLNKKIMILAFIESRIMMKNALNDHTIKPILKIVGAQEKEYLLGFDEYALSLIGGEK